MKSLRRKIIVGYAAVGLFVVALSLLTAYELSRLERGMLVEETVSALLDATMEVRRFEKNYLLYRQPQDLAQNLESQGDLGRLLDRHAGQLAAAGDSAGTAALRRDVARYAEAMSAYAAVSPVDATRAAMAESHLRIIGKQITGLAQGLAAASRRELHGAMRLHHRIVLGALAVGLVVMTGTGTLLYLSVTRPLKRMQHRMEEVAAGNLKRLDLAAVDEEFRSLEHAFNHVLGELEVRQQQMLVSEKLASLGVLLSGVAHELNNPLSNISTSCQILLEEGDSADPELSREMLQHVDEQVERAQRIVSTLLDFSRHQRFMTEPTALAPLVEDTLALVRAQVDPAVSLVVEVPDDLMVLADRPRLQQVLLNLTKNAAEATGPGGRVTLRAALAATADEVEIEVRDNGCGIAEADLPHVFDPFFTTKDVGKGSGLGLFIVHDIIQKHGGRISVVSRPGEGTAFLIRLPLTRTMEPSIAR